MIIYLFNIDRNAFSRLFDPAFTAQCQMREISFFHNGIRQLTLASDAFLVLDPTGREQEILECFFYLKDESLFDRIVLYSTTEVIAEFRSEPLLRHKFSPDSGKKIQDYLSALIGSKKTTIFNRRKVLAIDDVVIIRNIMRNIFARTPKLHHLDLLTAGSVAEAKNILTSEDNVDLIILDWMMPEISGMEFLRELRKHEKLKNVKIMMCTSVGEQDRVREAIGTGVDDYLVKPIMRADLVKRICKLLPNE